MRDSSPSLAKAAVSGSPYPRRAMDINHRRNRFHCATSVSNLGSNFETVKAKRGVAIDSPRRPQKPLWQLSPGGNQENPFAAQSLIVVDTRVAAAGEGIAYDCSID